MEQNLDQENKNESNTDAPVMEQGGAPAPEARIDESTKHEPSEEVDNSADTNAAPEVGEELSKVASSPKRNVFVFGMMALGFVFMAWKLIGPLVLGDNEPAPITDTAPLPQGESVEMPIEIEDSTPPIPQLPEPPKLIAPTPPTPPVITEAPAEPAIPPLPIATPESAAPAPPSATQPLPTNVDFGADDEAQAKLEAKRRSPIQLIGGAAGGGADPNAGADANLSEAEKTQASDFQRRGNLNYVLGKGKIIEVVTETAINSDHPSEVRAIVTRDVYAESGKLILIPKGTRVFGEFAVTIDAGYGRVDIKWNRIDLASGYTINISSPAVDALGRSGVQAVVDHKYKEQMANAVLSSAFSIAVAAGVDKLVPPVETTQTAANTQQANSLQSTALSIFNDQSKNENTRRDEICLTVKNQFPDKTSAAYTAFNQACLAAAGNTSGSPADRLNSVMNAVTTAATGLVAGTAQATTPSNKQKAAEQAFKDLSSKMEDIVQQQALKPTTTVDQGTPVKIYIKKDYLFPKDAVARARIIR